MKIIISYIPISQHFQYGEVKLFYSHFAFNKPFYIFDTFYNLQKQPVFILDNNIIIPLHQINYIDE